MLVLGAIFQCLGPILTVAAILSSKPLFLNPMDKREEATQYAQHKLFGAQLLTYYAELVPGSRQEIATF